MQNFKLQKWHMLCTSIKNEFLQQDADVHEKAKLIIG
jgi:hypothetical protein